MVVLYINISLSSEDHEAQTHTW